MGQQIIEIMLTIFMVLGIGKISENFEPKQYYAILETGKIMQIEISRFNKYACPKKCKISHFHRVYVCKDEYVNHPDLIQMIVDEKNKFIPISIGNKKIIDFVEFIPEKSKRKKIKTKPIKISEKLPWF